MQVLVTGGVGFVGTNLCERLINDNHEVWSFDNYTTGDRKNELEGVKYYNIDIREFGSGNAGATNTFRVLGKKAGIPVLFFDIFKGL